MTDNNDEKTTDFDACGELIRILTDHAAKYPLMQPTDVVKLVYQNEFGSEHFVTDEKECLARLEREAASVKRDEKIPLTEDIGNGVRRVNLNSARIGCYPPEKLNADFIALSETHKGAPESFRQKLAAVSEHFDGIGFGFSKESFDLYLREYEKAGFPPVSHSDIYRENYHPAYRLTEW